MSTDDKSRRAVLCGCGEKLPVRVGNRGRGATLCLECAEDHRKANRQTMRVAQRARRAAVEHGEDGS